MMINKVKLYGWLALLLLVVNLVTLGTIFYQNRDEEAKEMLVIEPDTPPINGCYFRQQLGFNETQMATFRQSNREFRMEANRIICLIHDQKEAMYVQLKAEKPSQTEIERISAEIGTLHKDLKMATARFYLSLREVATPEQQLRLEQIFEPLFRTTPSSGNCSGRNGQPQRNCRRGAPSR